VTLTSNFVSAVLETDGIILHCNEAYKPCGVTAPLERVIDQRAFLHQVSRPKRLNERIWQRLLRGKTFNRKRHAWHRLTGSCQERQEATDLTFMIRPS
jgi:CRISPR-associated protein Cas1